MKNRKIVSISFAVIAIILAIISWLVLPKEAIVQIDFHGNASNVKSKLFAVLLPLALTICGAIWYQKIENSKWKGIVIAVCGIGASIFTLVVN